MSEEFIFQSIHQGKNIESINKYRDVAEMCGQCIKFEAQRSPFFEQLCEVCAQISDSAVKALNDVKNKEQLCLDVIEACKKLSESCRHIIQLKDKDFTSDSKS